MVRIKEESIINPYLQLESDADQGFGLSLCVRYRIVPQE